MTTTHTSAKNHRKQRMAARRQAKLRNWLFFIGSVLFLAAVVVALGSSGSGGAVQPARIGEPISNLSLKDLSGKVVRIEDYAGQPVLINAWATWCPPCKAEMPDLNAFYEAHKAEGFVLLAVNAGENQAQVSSFIQNGGFSFPVLLDPNTETLGRLGVNSFPTSILVGRDGVVKTVHVGILTPEALQTEIVPLLQ